MYIDTISIEGSIRHGSTRRDNRWRGERKALKTQQVSGWQWEI